MRTAEMEWANLFSLARTVMVRAGCGFCFALGAGLLGGLALADQTIKPGQDLAQITGDAADGTVIKLASGRFNGPIVVLGKTLTIIGQPDGSSIVATDRFNAVVAVQDGGHARLENVAIEAGQPDQLGIYVKGAALEMAGGNVSNSTGEGIYVEAGRLLLNNALISKNAGIGIVAQKGAEVGLEHTNVHSANATGLHFQDGTQLSISDSTIEGKSALVVFGGAPVVTIHTSQFSAHTVDAAVAFHQGGSISFLANTVTGGQDAIYVSPAPDAKVEVSENTVSAMTRGGLTIDAKAPLTAPPVIRGNNILAGGGENAHGIFLNGAMSAQLFDNLIAVPDGAGVALQAGATAHLSGDVIVSNVATMILQASDAVTVIDNVVLVPAGKVSGQPKTDPGTQALAAALDAKRAEALLTGARAAAAQPAPGTVSRYFADLSTQVSALRGEGAAFGTVTLRVRDAAGKELFAPFTLTDDQGNDLSHQDLDSQSASVAAGHYLVAPDFDPLTTAEITVVAGQPAEVRIEAPDALWVTLTYNDQRPPHPSLLKLRPPEERTEVARTMRLAYEYYFIAERRGSATAGDLAKARAIAIEWLRDLAPVSRPKDKDSAAWGRYGFAQDVAYRTLSAAGDADTANWLAENLQGRDYPYVALADFAVLTEIESRLGRLRTGHLYAMAQSKRPSPAVAAAIVLHRQGIRDFDRYLLEVMGNPANEDARNFHGSDFIRAMWDTGTPEVLALVRQLWQEYRTRDAELMAMTEAQRKDQGNALAGIQLATMVYLLAYGEPADWATLPFDTLDEYAANAVVAFGADINQVAGMLMDRRQLHPLYAFASTLAALRGTDAETAHKALSDNLFSAVYEQSIADRNENPPDRAQAFVNTFDLLTTAYWPNESASKNYYSGEGMLKEVEPLPWAPFEWRFDDVIDVIIKGDRGNRFESHIDLMPHATLVDLLARKNMAGLLASADLLIAYHTVATQESMVDDVTWSGRSSGNGSDWQRPFLMKVTATSPTFGGVISGRLDLTPSFADDELRLTFDLPHAAFYHDLCTWAAQISTDNCTRSYWLVDAPAKDARALIARVRLMRDEEEIPLRVLPTSDIDHPVYGAAIPGRDLAGLRVHVDLKLDAVERTLTFALYRGAFARSYRLATANLASVSAQVGSDQDADALLRLASAQRAAGALSDAWATYQHLIVADPGTVDHWYEAGAMFDEAGMFDRALEVYEAAAAIRPDDLDLRLLLGEAAYKTSDFTKAAAAFGAVVTAAPDNLKARTWLGHSQFLAHKWTDAAGTYGGLPPDGRSPQLALLRLIAEGEAAGGKPADLASYDAAIKDLAENAAPDACQLNFYRGYRERFAGHADQAAASFEQARGRCALGTVEQRALAAMVQ